MDYFLFTLFSIVCLLLIIVVLLQKGRGGGLGAAFGGMASSAFGTRVGDVFTWVTIVLVALFLLLAIGTTMWFQPAPTQIRVPAFNPPPGAYSEAQVVTISSSTPNARIYYTTDDLDPSENSALYDSAVRVEPGITLKARAYRAGGWKPSAIAVGYYGPPPAIPESLTDETVSPLEIETAKPLVDALGTPVTAPAEETTPPSPVD